MKAVDFACHVFADLIIKIRHCSMAAHVFVELLEYFILLLHPNKSIKLNGCNSSIQHETSKHFDKPDIVSVIECEK